MFNPYVKAVLAAIIAVAGALGAGYDDSILTTSEIVLAVGAGVVALGAVWATSTGKAFVSAAVAGLASVGVSLQDDKLSAQEVTTIIIATVTALGAVYAATNAPEKATVPRPA